MNTRFYDMSRRRSLGRRGLGRRGAGGFTLIELLITLAILGILTAIAVPVFLGQREKAMRTEATTNLLVLRQKMVDYYNENMSYGADGTYNYTTTSTTIQTILPGFKPGTATDLYYNYTIVVSSTGQAFIASATGRTGKAVAGTVLSIDQDNTKAGF